MFVGAYTTEKGGINISYKDPLLFVQGPPMFVKMTKTTVIEEESTSVFYPSESPERETIEINSSLQTETKVVNPVIENKIRYLSRPFQKQAYNPLQFVVEGDILKGNILKMEDDMLWIESDEVTTEIEIAKIDDILWRGQSFDGQ